KNVRAWVFLVKRAWALDKWVWREAEKATKARTGRNHSQSRGGCQIPCRDGERGRRTRWFKFVGVKLFGGECLVSFHVAELT
ncbi:hypothetical protein NL676_005226, partial [Syzygium grande]